LGADARQHPHNPHTGTVLCCHRLKAVLLAAAAAGAAEAEAANTMPRTMLQTTMNLNLFQNQCILAQYVLKTKMTG